MYIAVILPVVLYGCKAQSVTLREEHRLRVFENRVLRKIFGPKRDEVTGKWRKLLNEELCGLYSSSGDQIKKNQLDRTCSTMGERNGTYRVLVGRCDGKNHLEDLSLGGSIILIYICKKWDGKGMD